MNGQLFNPQLRAARFLPRTARTLPTRLLPPDTPHASPSAAPGPVGLAAAVTLLAKERGDIRPVLQLLSYPMLDDRTTTRPTPGDCNGPASPPPFT